MSDKPQYRVRKTGRSTRPYVVQKLDGYTDGKPSWLTVGAYTSRERAVVEMMRRMAGCVS